MDNLIEIMTRAIESAVEADYPDRGYNTETERAILVIKILHDNSFKILGKEPTEKMIEAYDVGYWEERSWTKMWDAAE